MICSQQSVVAMKLQWLLLTVGWVCQTDFIYKKEVNSWHNCQFKCKSGQEFVRSFLMERFTLLQEVIDGDCYKF